MLIATSTADSVEVVATVTARCDPAEAIKVAYPRVDAALNLLRCLSYASLRNWDHHGVPGEIATSLPVLIIEGAESTKDWLLHHHSLGRSTFLLTSNGLRLLREYWNLNGLGEMLGKLQPSPIERLLTTGIRWIGRAMANPEPAEQVLNFSVGLECMLLGQIREGELSDRFSRHLAFLLGRTPEARTEIYRSAGALYRLRSKVVHNGKTLVQLSDLTELAHSAVTALVVMSKLTTEHGWSEYSQFKNWVEAQVFN